MDKKTQKTASKRIKVSDKKAAASHASGDHLFQHMNPIGKPPLYPNPQDLWDKAVEYFNWSIEHPIPIVNKSTKHRNFTSRGSEDGNGEEVQTAPRPFTLYGFCAWCSIANWTEFKHSAAHRTEDYLRVVRAIEDTITQQQLDGGLTGLYNSNLTARLNGISDKIEQVSDVRTQMTAEEAAAIILGK